MPGLPEYLIYQDNHMQPTFMHRALATPIRLLMCASLTIALAACGGGGGNPGAVSGGSNPTPPPGTSVEPRMTMTISDGSGLPITSLSGGQEGVVRVIMLDGAGVAAANAVVSFSSSDDSLIEFPGTGDAASALTDKDGVAVIKIKPVTVTTSGAVTIRASGVTLAGKSATAAANIAVGAAPLVVGTLSFIPAQSGTLAAFSTAALNVPITSAGAPATDAAGLTMSSLCTGDGTAKLDKGALTNGVQAVTYTNLGCLRVTDVITVSIGNSSQTISIQVGAAGIGTIQFVGSDLAGSSIVLRGSGGLGRKESALLTFRVLDQNNNGLAGVDVNFKATTTTGGLVVAPAKGTTDATGLVTTTVSSGTLPTPVRVQADATRNGVTISGLSDTLTISTGLPIQKAMSLSVDAYNIEGLNYDGVVANLTIRLADQYANKISDATAVNFISEGGSVGSSAQGACTTTEGACSVELTSQSFRPLNGRVTVMAYAQGIEDFVDSNGDGMFSCSNSVAGYRPLVDPCTGVGEPFTDMGDPFLDTGNLAIITGTPNNTGTLDNTYDPAKGDLPIPYNSSSYKSLGNGAWGLNYIRSSTEIVFSGSFATLVRQVCEGNPVVCRDWNSTDGDPYLIKGLHGASCSSKGLAFRLHDVNNNPMPFKSSVATIDADNLEPSSVFPNAIGSTSNLGGTYHSLNIKPDTACAAGRFTLLVTTPKDNGSAFTFYSAP
jgi:hypothetical protein